MGLQTSGIIFLSIAILCITVVLVYSYYKILSHPLDNTLTTRASYDMHSQLRDKHQILLVCA